MSGKENVSMQRVSPRLRAPGAAMRWCAALLGCLVLCACTAKQYRRAADKEVYRIIQQTERKIFGHTNAFTIETPYSQRKPETVLPAELIDDRLLTNRRVITIDQALELAATTSRRFQTEKERLYLTALTLTGARYEFSPQFFAGSGVDLVRERSETRLNVASEAGVSQTLMTGGRLSARLANDVLRYYTGDPRRSILSAVSVNLAQPLLRGFGRNNPAVENLTQAERNVIYAVRSFNYFQDSFAVEIVNDYFALLAQKDIIRNRYTNYLSRGQSTKRLEARAEDRERVSDVDQARQAELTAKNNYVNSVAAFQTALDQFKIKLGLPVSEKVYLDDSALADLKTNGLVGVQIEATHAFRLALERQYLLLNAIDIFEDSKRKVRVAANRLLPDLTLVADATQPSEGPTDYTRFDPNDIRAGVGLQLDLPLDRLNERNSYRATLVSFEAELRDFTLTLDSLRDSIERGLRTLAQREQNYLIQQNALELANRRVDSTTLLLQAGRAEVRDLVEAQDAQIAAQNALTAALVDHQEARLQLMLDLGTLQASLPHFWLHDHLAILLQRPPTRVETGPQAQTPVVPPELFFNQ